VDLNIVLWAMGTLFSLGIFAVKVGFGLGYGRFRAKGIIVTLLGYVLLFVAIALVSGKLMELAMPILKKGPYIHLLMAAGMIVWGVYMLRGGHGHGHAPSSIGDSAFKSSLLLIVPCPVCLSAMSFSTWTALGALQMPPALVGLGLGASFAILSLVFLFLSRFAQSAHPDASLGLAMVAIGLYFIGSLLLPAKIEEGRAMYASFTGAGATSDASNMAGVLLILFVGLAMGWVIRQKGHKR
jgi:predicted transporter